MQIISEEPPKEKLSTISSGDCFRVSVYSPTIFMKVADPEGRYNAVSVSSGLLHFYPITTLVVKVDAYLGLKEEGKDHDRL